MKRFTSLILAVAILPTVTLAASLEDVVKASLARQSDLAYGAILAEGVRAGRIYTREAAASGARRHAAEFVLRQFVVPRLQADADN